MRYIIDITQLIHWPGNLTGIPRVMDELAVRFLQDTSHDVVFVSWVKEVEQMCEVDFATTRTRRGVDIHYAKKNSTESGISSTNSAANTSNFPALAKKVVKKLAVKSRFDRTQLYKKAVDTRSVIMAQSYKTYTPQEGDKFFIPWGEWWDQRWLDLVKKFVEKNVEIYPISHDILPMIVPQFSGNSASLADFVTQIFPLATTVLTISESTKKDLIEWMKSHKLAVPSIKVFRLGEDFTITKTNLDDKVMREKYDVKKNSYIVYVGTIEPRKNHAILYYTYKLAHARGIRLPKLLIVGRVGHDVSEIIKLIKEDSDVNQLISIQNGVDDNDLNWLYQNCMFTVMPSFYEGWGMPIIESIARNKPAVISNTSSLLEMPDQCVIRFNPASTDECLQAIQQMATPDTLKEYRTHAANYRTHSWDEAYEQVTKILEEK